MNLSEKQFTTCRQQYIKFPGFSPNFKKTKELERRFYDEK
mgnify:CR=1 FL=1